MKFYQSFIDWFIKITCALAIDLRRLDKSTFKEIAFIEDSKNYNKNLPDRIYFTETLFDMLITQLQHQNA